MKIINKTPHDIKLFLKDGSIKLFKTEGVIRTTVESMKVDNIGEYEIYKNKYGAVNDLPPYEEGTYYIVSRIVAEACKDRNDLLLVNDTVRDEDGKIIGCKSFSKL